MLIKQTADFVFFPVTGEKMKLEYALPWCWTIPPGRFHLRNDCVIRAIVTACKLPYDVAERICVDAGWNARLGVNTGSSLYQSGVRHRTIDASSLFEPNVRGNMRYLDQQTYPTFKTVAPLLTRGRFILTTRCHAFAVIDGVQYDLRENRPRVRIKRIYEINL